MTAFRASETPASGSWRAAERVLTRLDLLLSNASVAGLL